MQLKINYLLGALIVGGVLATACNPQTPAPTATQPATSSPTAKPPVTASSSATPSVLPSDTPQPTSTEMSDATAEPTVTLAPTVLPPTNIADVKQPTAEPLASGIAVFSSASLGISFHYAKGDSGTDFATKESGDKAYVYMKTAQPETGQWVQVFSKPAKTSLEDAIKSQVLQGYSLTDCIVKLVSDPNKSSGSAATPGITFAMITIPQSPDDDPGAIQTKAAKCPQPYAAVGGLAYFMTTNNAPERFVFFSIGQYFIPAEQNHPWQTTLKFIATSANPAVNVSAAQYIDDRSNPERLVASLINAINRREYPRAYGYWQNTDQLAPFDQYAQGYAKTDSVTLKTGPVRGSAGAGQFYYTIPAILAAKMADGSTQTFVACYQIHLSNPGMQVTPPFSPMAIQKAYTEKVSNNSATATLLSQICQKGSFPDDPLSPAGPSNAPDSQRYTDDRSSAVAVLRSLVNAINRKEYSRAYSYWEPGSVVAPFSDFQNGYVKTASVAVTTGAVQSDAGAGQLYYNAPVTLKAKMSDGSTQTFVGCYVFHLANPGIQSPPFQPLGIKSATVKKVANNADTTILMKSACPAS